MYKCYIRKIFERTQTVCNRDFRCYPEIKKLEESIWKSQLFRPIRAVGRVNYSDLYDHLFLSLINEIQKRVIAHGQSGSS